MNRVLIMVNCYTIAFINGPLVKNEEFLVVFNLKSTKTE